MRIDLPERERRLGALFIDRDGITVPGHYGDLRGEYTALREDAGVIDLAHFGALRVAGRDRVTWLHKLATANVDGLGEGHGACSLLLDARGHVVADFVVLRLRDALLLYAAWRPKEKLAASLRHAIFREQVTLTDVSDALCVLTLQGARAGGTLGRSLGTLPALEPLQFGTVQFHGNDVLIVHNPRAGNAGFDLLVARGDGAALWDALIGNGARAVGVDALNVARVEAGIAWYGDDFDEGMLAPEARLDPFIAEDKGCYTGQEVIARIRHRGHVNRLLVQLQIEGDVVPERGDRVFSSAGEVGWITSAVWSYARHAPLALGYLRREEARQGAHVQIARGETRVDAVVHSQ